MHGDAAFAGQGVVAETLNLSQLRGYRTGGTIHVVVNNQVGTTSPEQSRSSIYCTDVARMVQAPIFHVNGDDPEACNRVARLAFEFRQEFAKDVVIDLVCYRRRGHNEGDDPSFTQPLMYDLIEQKRSVRKLYTEALIGRGDITFEEAEQALRDYQQELERVFSETRQAEEQAAATITVPSYPVKPLPAGGLVTAVTDKLLKQIADSYLSLPDGFTVHPKVQPQLQRRAAMLTEGGIDWGTAEIAAFASLLVDGRPIRLAGQDSRRGTFVQRFAAIVDRRTGVTYIPLQHLDKNQAKFYIYDSLLSEFAAMGFEYGYSVARPEAFVLWEAQFGDFANGAQTIIDEFIVGGQSKWNQRSGVVLLLPATRDRAGPLLRPDRALPGHGCRRRLPNRPAVDSRVVLPPAPAACARRGAQADDRVHAQVDAPSQEGGFRGGRPHRRNRVPAGTSRQRRRRVEGRQSTALLRQDRVGSAGRARQAGRRAHGDPARGTALPARDRVRADSVEPVPRVARGAVGPGRTAEHGTVAVHGAAPAAESLGSTSPASPARGGRSVLRVALAARRSTA